MQNSEQQVGSHCQDKSHSCKERGCSVHPLFNIRETAWNIVQKNPKKHWIHWFSTSIPNSCDPVGSHAGKFPVRFLRNWAAVLDRNLAGWNPFFRAKWQNEVDALAILNWLCEKMMVSLLISHLRPLLHLWEVFRSLFLLRAVLVAIFRVFIFMAT